MDDQHRFKNDILIGLSQSKKQINSKYLYDERGCELFDKITSHPDYYLTACELEILKSNSVNISEFIAGKNINIIELGPGEGIKTELILRAFVKSNHFIKYFPVDISRSYLINISKKLQNVMPSLYIQMINLDYLNSFDKLNLTSPETNLILFLGSTIGNYELDNNRIFLSKIKEKLKKGDYLFIGFDLIKEKQILFKAYDDSDGITRAFNFNLLNRINRELKANFILNEFRHLAKFNSSIKAMESYLVSAKKQIVKINKINTSFNFERDEAIHVEYSFKYSINQIEDLAIQAGFEIVHTFFDEKHYFADSLWIVK